MVKIYKLFLGEIPLATRLELSEFLAGVERRAFKQAMFAVRNEETAMDIVQDSMLKLALHYSGNEAAEWPMLFQRILQNTIRDSYRRAKVRSLWTTLFSSFTNDDDEDIDPLEALPVDAVTSNANNPHQLLERTQLLDIIEKEVMKLPLRQRQAFLMRYWEEMDIADTAFAMGCSEGSVKVHCSRATKTLAAALKSKGIEL
jgi:RNA polymerase sigma-70 factor (ECF subfamily)